MLFHCATCGWSGQATRRGKCLACDARRAKEWRAAHPDQAKQHRRKWRERRIEREPAYWANKARRRRGRNWQTAKRAWQRRADWLAAGDVTRQQLREVYARDGGRCVYCRTPVKAAFNPKRPRGFDHVRPRIAGGKHTAGNLVVACRYCNERKPN